jgi:type II secretion system protein J
MSMDSCGMRNRRFGAFTLIELLIALTILSVIAALSYTSFVSVRRIVDIRRSSDENLRNIRSFVERLDVELSSAVYVRREEETLFRSTREEVEGKETSTLIFTTILPHSIYDIGKREEIVRVEYELISNEENRELLVLRKRLYPFILSPESTSEPVEYVVSEELTAFLLRFHRDGKWYESWDTEKMDLLPDSVELTFSLGDNLYREYFNVYISET